jgi:hypothetical protein
MERRSQGADHCGELRGWREGVLYGAAAWVEPTYDPARLRDRNIKGAAIGKAVAHG